MNTLLIDAGNTRVKCAVLAVDGLRNIGNVQTGGDGEQLCDLLRASGEGCTRAIAVSVLDHAGERNLGQQLHACLGLELAFARTGARHRSLRNAYVDTDHLGADRWYAMIAAYNDQAGPHVVIGAGTALTVDLIADGGQHIGGVIAPGKGILQRAVRRCTARVGADQQRWVGEFGASTSACVEAGWTATWRGLLAELERLITRSTLREPTVSVHGGDAEDVLAAIAGIHRPNLVLEGLARSILDE